AFWIIVANGCKEFHVGMSFNPDTARNEKQSFFEVALSPVAISKFLHTIGGGYVISALFVMGISAWFMLQGRHIIVAKKSLVV
ncbi:cytochrome ubiquinol oxidase subunit I, partial [Campylobacter jejuni]|uniref:cytochrome ubiquinol oxidase subunit I n=1 Tax=Campylobacter jejuni TaxID=197 RepID=UPI0018F8A854